MNAEKINDDATTETTDSAQADAPQSTAADKAALAAGGNSLGGVRAEGEPPFADSSVDGLLLSATDLLALVELEPLNTEESTKMLQVLGSYHHAIFSRRVDTVAQAACRDKFHERLHALRHQVAEAQRVAQEERESRERHAAQQPHAPETGPQPMGGVVDAAVKVMREEWRQDVTHTNNIVQSLVIEMGQLRAVVGNMAESHRDHIMSLQARAAELERVAEMYQRKLDGLAERVFSMEVPLDRLAKLEARVLALDGVAVVDADGNVVRREPPNRYLLNTSIVHITSEAEMVEAFGEGRGQAMWAECEARKSGGAK